VTTPSPASVAGPATIATVLIVALFAAHLAVRRQVHTA
jgi:hypothetical protein